MSLRNEVLKACARFGADMAGVAPVERFRNAPLRMSPRGLLPPAKSVIVAGIHHPDACIELDGEPSPHDRGPYSVQNIMNARLDDISFMLAKHLEKKGYRTIPVAASNIWRYKGYKDMKVDFAPDIVHRYAAVAAGLGEIGWSGLFLTHEYGPRQRVVSIITEAEIEPDPMYEGPSTCDRCMACVKACPTDAFRKEVKGMNRVDIGGKVFEFPDTNKWRCAWAENFCLSLEHDMPERIDENVILKYLEKYGPRGGEVGSCLKFCMGPEKRYYDLSYSRAPRRKKDVSQKPGEALLKDIEKICLENCIDTLVAGSKNKFSGNVFTHPEYHLPDVESVVSIGIKVRKAWAGNKDVMAAVNRKLSYASFEITRSLDLAGHSAVTLTKIPDEIVARVLGSCDCDSVYMTVLTSASLPEAGERFDSSSGKDLDKSAVKRLCLESGADMVGVFSIERFEEFLHSTDPAPAGEERKTVTDKGYFYGSFIPEIVKKDGRIKKPGDWLAGAKSVIVMGLRLPDAPLDFSKTTPAGSVGPFAFVKYESLLLLKDCALKVIKEITDGGMNAVFTVDLSGLASETASSRRNLPDMRSNMYEAVLAGLAYPGLHGYPLTEEYGTGQRFIAVVTDIECESDPLYSGDFACAACSKPCLDACPTRALGDSVGSFCLGGKSFSAPNVDCFSCDWAKLYGMSGEEGPKYCGLQVDEPVPPEKTAEKAAEKMSQINWGVQKKLLDIVEECLRVCPAGKAEPGKE